MTVKPLQKKQNMNTLLLNFFSCIGFIPTTKFEMHVVNVITAIFVVLATAIIFVRNYLSVASGYTVAFAIITALTDIVFICIGALCPYLNYKLKRTLSNQDMKGPVWPILLFVILFIMVGVTIGYLVYPFVYYGQQVLDLFLILYLTSSVFMCVAILLIFTHLYYFGCCVRKSKDEMIRLVVDMEEFDGSNDKKYAAKCYDLLTSYKQIQESVSLGLFLIFTLITIVSIFFIFISITTDGLFNTICGTLWCSALLLILGYLGLASDEADQVRINLVDNMWTIYVSESDSGKPLLLATIFKFQLVGPLSAEGFYDVNRGLLVALIGTLLTYIIILVQMKDMFH